LPAPYRRAEPITAGHRCRSAGERRRGGRLARITPVDVSAALDVLGAQPSWQYVRRLRGGSRRSAPPSSSRASWRPLQRTTCSPLRSPRDQALPPRHEVLVPLPSIVVQSKTRISQLKLTCHEPEKSPNQPLYLITAPDISMIFWSSRKVGIYPKGNNPYSRLCALPPGR
jgi:hypothetical protein